MSFGFLRLNQTTDNQKLPFFKIAKLKHGRVQTKHVRAQEIHISLSLSHLIITRRNVKSIKSNQLNS